ncbi:MAG: group 1 glycosyl transferase, partial [Halanaerobium sp.]
VFNHLSFMFSSILFSLRKIGKIDITVVSSPTFFSIFSGYLFSLIKRTPFILEIRDLWPAAIVELGVLKNKFIISVLEAIELFFYRRADKIVVVTRSFKENLISRGIDAEKIEVITNGVDINFFKNKSQNKELIEKYNLEDKFIVEYIGAHGLSQALDKIIYAAEKLKEYEDIHFVFVGEGAEKEKIMDLSKELGLNNITFISQKPKEMMPEFYNIADICLVPLKDVELFETFIPSKIFEIMACEKPIVASLSGETKNILDEAQSAVTVEPENIDQIAAAILEIKNNPQKAEEMGKKGRGFVVENYSRSSLADKYLNVMNQAMEGK